MEDTRPATEVEFAEYAMEDQGSACPWCGAVWTMAGSGGSRHHDDNCPYWIWLQEPDGLEPN